MFDKFKKFTSDVGQKAGRTVEYAKGKTSGFHHPEAVEEYVQVLRWNRDQIPKMYSRVSSLVDATKEIAGAQNKLSQEFQVLGGHEQEHPELAQYIRAMADGHQTISDAHFVLHAKLDEIKQDWKTMDTKDLSDIKVIHDKANHALTDARYWRTHSNPSKLADAESKYKQYSSELVDMINRLREKKETLFPEYMMRMAAAMNEFYSTAHGASENIEQTLRSIGPVTPHPSIPLSTGFELGDLGVKAEADDEKKGKAAPTPQARSLPPQPPSRARARGLYAFAAQGPDELSFNVGDVLNVISSNGDWWTAELNGRQGLIPGNYVQLI